jgi:DNA-binding response OmpR family regulator
MSIYQILPKLKAVFAQQPAVNKRILWVEENGGVRAEITALLRNAGYSVHSSGDLVEAMILSMTGHYDLCLLGDWPSYGEENRFCEKIRKYNPECPILFYTLKSPQQNLRQGVEAGAWGYLTRPADDFALKGSIAALLDSCS